MFILINCLVWFIIYCNADQEKVFGGRFASKGEFPSAVAVVMNAVTERMICGGTLVVLDKVFTTAHCMLNKTGVLKLISNFKIYGGSTTIPFPPSSRRGEGLQERSISKVKIHEGLKRKKDGTNYHDVALIILEKPFIRSETLSEAIYPANDFLGSWRSMVLSQKRCVGVGWGTTIFKNRKKGPPVASMISEDLKAIYLIPLDQKICSKFTKKEDIDMTEKGEVCVSNTAKGESVCKGDSGSPLYCDGYVFAHARASIGCGNRTRALFYLLHGPYIDYFVLRLNKKNLPNNPDVGSLLVADSLFLLIMSSILVLNTIKYK